LEEIGRIDILFIPVGSVYTIDYAGAVTVIEALKPKVTIAMHFKTQALTFELDTPERFIKATGAKRLTVDDIDISTDNIGEIPSTILLNYK
jgi:L-ascorbate metabolism protein UlaG (beta-lactamase superfamily)